MRHSKLVTISLAVAWGCAGSGYAPPTPPTFMAEEIAAARGTAPAVPPQQSAAAYPSPGPKRVTLAQAIAECFDADPVIQAGAQSIVQARADLWTASLLPNPTLEGGGTLLPLGEKLTPEHPGGPPQYGAGVAFPVDWLLFGKRWTAVDSARAALDVSAAQFADLVRQRIAATVSAFYGVLQAEELLELAKQTQENLKHLEAITAELVQIGGAGTVELDRVRLMVLDGQRELRAREGDVAIAKAALRSQLGRAAPEPEFDVDGSLDIPQPVPPPPLEQSLGLAEQNRPDLVSGKLQIAKAEADYRSEQAKAFPEVTPRLGYVRQLQHDIGDPDLNLWEFSVEMTLPVFDRNQGNLEKARSVLVQANSAYRAQRVQLRTELEQATQALAVAYAAVTTDAPARIAAARNVRDKIVAAYQAGGRPLIDVLDAERAYRDSARLDVLDRATYWKSLHLLNAVVGKEMLR